MDQQMQLLTQLLLAALMTPEDLFCLLCSLHQEQQSDDKLVFGCNCQAMAAAIVP